MDGFKPNEGGHNHWKPQTSRSLGQCVSSPWSFFLTLQVTVPSDQDVKGRTEILKWYLCKISMTQWPERRSVEIDAKNKTITAYHESGHAIIAYFTKDAMPINKATIMPRGPTLGHVSLLPENDRWSETRSQLLAQMDVSMGGRVAEEIIFGPENITTGASSDFDSATKIAKLMVTRFGMSEKLGVMTYSDTGKLSPETQAAIEQEVRTLLKDSYERAKNPSENSRKRAQKSCRGVTNVRNFGCQRNSDCFGRKETEC
ncbi:unnamed protein product [Ranitomeya imitator]|uniref:Peptidase M41 domain-containing protein n=1 Tax=Ranitomeya imitator TaxID=111125 RepID=A0ABN9LSZ6_9NEOB|nr:unnamed protein product [Ranitomeya imitator]